MASPPVAQVLLSERWRSHDWAEGGADKEETLEEGTATDASDWAIMPLVIGSER